MRNVPLREDNIYQIYTHIHIIYIYINIYIYIYIPCEPKPWKFVGSDSKPQVCLTK